MLAKLEKNCGVPAYSRNLPIRKTVKEEGPFGSGEPPIGKFSNLPVRSPTLGKTQNKDGPDPYLDPKFEKCLSGHHPGTPNVNMS